jgi:hypothetical protein
MITVFWDCEGAIPAIAIVKEGKQLRRPHQKDNRAQEVF